MAYAADWSDVRAHAHATGDGWGFWLTDKTLSPIGDLHGMHSIEGSDSVDETDTMEMDLPGDHSAVDKLLPVDELDPDDPELTWRKLIDESQFIITEGPEGHESRQTWRVHRITWHTTGRQAPDWKYHRVTVECKHIRRYVEKITCRADPGSALAVQLKYRDFRAGQAIPVLKEYVLVNLMRDFQPRAISGGWSLWDQARWRNVNPDLWPAMVNPVHDAMTTIWTVLDARFDSASDLLAETLRAAGLMLTVEMWLPGDPQPAPGYVTLTMPTIWIDIKSRQFDTSATGTPLDFLRGLVRTFDRENNAPRVGLGDTPATAAGRLPWVVWRPEDMAGSEMELTVVKSEDNTVTVGGKSPEILNKMIGAGSKSLFQGLASGLAMVFPMFAPLIVAAGVFLGEAIGASLQDKLFAWQSFTDSVRREAHGRYGYRDQVGAGDAWTLSAWQQGFSMLREGAGMVSAEFEGGERLAYQWGRDFRAGDQQGLIFKGMVLATYVSHVDWSWVQGRGWHYEITLGDPRARESVADVQQRSAQSIANGVKRFLTFVQ